MSVGDGKTCFVVMPFGEKPDVSGVTIDFDNIYEFLIKNVVASLNLTCVRSDEVIKPGSIHEDMLRHIMNDDVVIVDITTLNANVFYELGVRHTLRRSVTVLMRKKGTSIPFDIKGLRVLDYDIDLKGADLARKLLHEFIEAGLTSSDNDSLVYSVFPNLKVSLG